MKIVLLVLSLSVATVFAEQPKPPKYVAVVYSMKGQASMTLPGKPTKMELHLFDWLVEGSLVEVSANSRVALAFRNGKRWELTDRAKAVLNSDSLRINSGNGHPLPSVPTMPEILPITLSGRQDSGAVQIKDLPGKFRYVYPFDNSVTLAKSTVLRFSKVRGVDHYNVLVLDGNKTIFKQRTTSDQVTLPSNLLISGKNYQWRVEATSPNGMPLKMESLFRTLAAEDDRSRNILKQALTKNNDPEDLVLLAEVDRRLGLMAEAYEELKQAHSKMPENIVLRQSISELEVLLWGKSTEVNN